nr:DUF308 domain-containing protein [Histophilus somni]
MTSQDNNLGSYIVKKDNKILGVVLGIGLILVGIFILNSPLLTLLTIISYLAWAVLLRGLFSLFKCYKSHKNTQPFDKTELAAGIVLMILGVIFLTNPAFTSALVFYLVAFWFIFDGIVGIYYAAKQKEAVKWIGVVLGVLLVFFGLSISVEPLRAILALNLLLGLAVVTNGIQLLIVQLIKEK